MVFQLTKLRYYDIIYIRLNKKEHGFNEHRIKRSLYKTASGVLLNADIKGTLNMLRKSKVVSLSALYNRGVVDALAFT